VRLAVAVHPIAVHRMKPVIDRIFSFDQANRRLPTWRVVRILEKWRLRLDEPRHTKNGGIWSHATLAGSSNCFRRH
jgi:hypothetical protein